MSETVPLTDHDEISRKVTPAPAMREALITECIRFAQRLIDQEGRTAEWHASAKGLPEAIAALSSAPVPPADGALLSKLIQCPKCLWWSNDPQHEQTCQPSNSAERFKASHQPRMSAPGERDPSVMPDCRSAETALPRSLKSADDWRGVLWRERLRSELHISSDLDHRSWRDIKRALESLAASPSPAIAAEPETEQQFEDRLFKQEAADMLRLIDYIADKIGLPNEEELSRDNFNAWLATPSIRGDREAIALEVMNVRRRIHGLDDLDLETLRRIKRDAGINEAFAIADAILILPVQSGAREREATLHECANIAKFGAKKCNDGDTDWHKGFHYAANATALEIEGAILALSPAKPRTPAARVMSGMGDLARPMPSDIVVCPEIG